MKLLLIDGLNLVRRIFSALPESRTESCNENLTADSKLRYIRSCKQSLGRALDKHSPSHCLVVFEERDVTWRHNVLPSYKDNRKPMPYALASSLEEIKQAFRESGVNSFQLTGYEADDVIATFATVISKHGGYTIILSTDRLLCQLLSDDICIYDHFSNQQQSESMVLDKYGVAPDKIADVMALAGDTSLSISGVKSVGIKTAAKLISEFGNLPSVLNNASNIPGALGKNISENLDDARTAFQLFQLKTDISLGVNLKDFRYTFTDSQ